MSDQIKAPEEMHSIDGPLDPTTQIAANVDYRDPSVAKREGLGSDKEYRDGTENLRSQSSNALSFDSSGATQFVNLNAKALPDNFHQIPDGSNVNLASTRDTLVPEEQLGPHAGGPVQGEEGLGTSAETDVPAPGLNSETDSAPSENDPKPQPSQVSAAEAAEVSNPKLAADLKQAAGNVTPAPKASKK